MCLVHDLLRAACEEQRIAAHYIFPFLEKCSAIELHAQCNSRAQGAAISCCCMYSHLLFVLSSLPCPLSLYIYHSYTSQKRIICSPPTLLS